MESRTPCQELVLQMLKPKVVERLAQRLGLPPGIIPCLELEVARLQLCLALNRYKTVECDVGCEQDESEAWDTSDSSETSDTDDDVDAIENSEYNTDENDSSYKNAIDALLDDSNTCSSDNSTSSFKSLDNSSIDNSQTNNSNIGDPANTARYPPHSHSDRLSSSSCNDDSSYIPSGELI